MRLTLAWGRVRRVPVRRRPACPLRHACPRGLKLHVPNETTKEHTDTCKTRQHHHNATGLDHLSNLQGKGRRGATTGQQHRCATGHLGVVKQATRHRAGPRYRESRNLAVRTTSPALTVAGKVPPLAACAQLCTALRSRRSSYRGRDRLGQRQTD